MFKESEVKCFYKLPQAESWFSKKKDPVMYVMKKLEATHLLCVSI